MGTLKKITDTIITIRNSEAFKQGTAIAAKLLNLAFIEAKKLTLKAIESARGPENAKEAVKKAYAVKQEPPKIVGATVKVVPVKEPAKDAKMCMENAKATLNEKKESALLSAVRDLKKM